MNDGIKETEVGLIPGNWEIINLNKNFTLKARIGWQGLTVSEYLNLGSYTLVTGTDFKKGYIDWNNVVFVAKERYVQDPNIQLKAGDILVTKDGTIGKVAFISHLQNPATLNSGIFVIRPTKSGITSQYIYYVLMSFYFNDFLSRITAGSTITHLYQKDFIHFNFPLPPLTEQQAIAEALSNADSWIDSLEVLIEKKRLIKQGAIQELLRPKDGWEVRSLGDLGEVCMCKRVFQNQTSEYGEIPFYKIGTFGKQADAYISRNLFEDFKSKYSFPRKGDVLISAAGTIGRTVVYDGSESYFQDSNIVWISNKEEIITNDLLKYILQIVKYDTEGGTIQRLYNNILRNTQFVCPPLKDQPNITAILSDMDLEITKLGQKLMKAYQVKQGMMQQLLTGKIRLVKSTNVKATKTFKRVTA